MTPFLLSFGLAAGFVVLVWTVLLVAFGAIRRSRETTEYLDRVQQRMDHIANTN